MIPRVRYIFKNLDSGNVYVTEGYYEDELEARKYEGEAIELTLTTNGRIIAQEFEGDNNAAYK